MSDFSDINGSSLQNLRRSDLYANSGAILSNISYKDRRCFKASFHKRQELQLLQRKLQLFKVFFRAFFANSFENGFIIVFTMLDTMMNLIQSLYFII